MKKFLCVFCALLVLALSGCGESEIQDASTLVGQWQTDVDIAEYMNETMNLEYMVERFVIRIKLSFAQDGTMSLAFDRDYMNQQQNEMAENMWNVMMQMHADDLGLDIQEVEQIMEKSGWSSDILRASMGLDKVLDQLTDWQGRWEIKDNTLYMDPEDPTKAEPIQIKMNQGKLSMTGGSGIAIILKGAVAPERIDKLLPLVFERQA